MSVTLDVWPRSMLSRGISTLQVNYQEIEVSDRTLEKKILMFDV